MSVFLFCPPLTVPILFYTNWFVCVCVSLFPKEEKYQNEKIRSTELH